MLVVQRLHTLVADNAELQQIFDASLSFVSLAMLSSSVDAFCVVPNFVVSVLSCPSPVTSCLRGGCSFCEFLIIGLKRQLGGAELGETFPVWCEHRRFGAIAQQIAS